MTTLERLEEMARQEEEFAETLEAATNDYSEASNCRKRATALREFAALQRGVRDVTRWYNSMIGSYCKQADIDALLDGVTK